MINLLEIYTEKKLRIYGFAFAAVYAVIMLRLYIKGAWLVDGNGIPVYTDFTCAWIAGLQAIHDNISALYNPEQFIKVQAELVVSKAQFYSTWPYPPTFFLILTPFSMLPYTTAFLSWNLISLFGCVAVVYFIVRRLSGIALVLASPFTAINFFGGQNGFITASLLGAALLSLERQPILAGIFIGCLTYKPHLGILIPVALAASRQWRAVASAAATAIILSGVSVAAFGIRPWEMFPRGFFVHAGILLYDPRDARDYWAGIQTVYGLVRYLGSSAAVAWSVQGITTSALGAVVWFVWRSPVQYALKAATLSAAALLATPYAYAYDMAAIAIPVAFLVRDQIDGKLLTGEQTTMLALFLASLPVFLVMGQTAIGVLITLTLFCLILRRVHDR